ncbi:MAG: tetraacyldisaccharide 4'-kinase [Acidobacteria bacterium]|nr:MAG: tetraacyldisaccharide 4'-kinase [Acidobacteriota bacterium]REK03921.1 MAG: tetraacyldisaccharide 4'-kinase [Acidobacteriota bacterium]REK15083.1 MAG: tetraacyldisaccharide 4'-kinase [Acidobacteriota bacterium]REK46173.1 MAG: tetraacyldisaccharide 4'-kinase [Acidobacteriota bacterium]
MGIFRDIASLIYGRVLDTRNVLYDFAIFRSYKIKVPVISVGNITLGGTGKTPLVSYIASLIAEEGGRPAVVSRGYKRKDENKLVVVSDGEKIIEDAELTGDEPLELALDLRERARVVCDSDRVRGAVYAAERLGATAVVLDDAFQHRRISRDLDIVVIDATAPFGSGKTVPSGRLREPLHNLSRADAAILTRSDATDRKVEIVDEIRKLSPSCAIFSARTETRKILRITGEGLDSEPQETVFFLFSAIGNPASLEAQMMREGIAIAGSKRFRDHHKYTEKDICEIVAKARESGADALLTTGKDAVKLREFDFGMPCYRVKSRLVIDDETAFREMILQAATGPEGQASTPS